MSRHNRVLTFPKCTLCKVMKQRDLTDLRTKDRSRSTDPDRQWMARAAVERIDVQMSSRRWRRLRHVKRDPILVYDQADGQ